MTLQLIKQALDQIRLHPLRSFLAVLGTMNGIMAVVMVVAIGQGHRMVIKQRFNELGTNLLIVSPYVPNREGETTPNVIQYSPQDMIWIKNACLSVNEVAPFIQGNLEFQYQRRSVFLQVIGTDVRYAIVKNLTLKRGRFLSALDLELGRPVVVLNETATKRLLGSDNLQSDFELLTQGTSVSVVGVVQDNIAEFGVGQPIAYVPIPLYKRLIDKPYQNLLGIYVLISEAFPLERGIEEVKSVLKEAHGPEAADAVKSMTEFLVAFRDINKRAILALVAMASITLVLGGIGISNLLLASVRERTREIGVRKALGAKDRAILFQFLTEGVVLSVLGGVLGVFLGIGGLFLLLPALELPIIFPSTAILIGMVFSIGVGIFSSYYPARIAAKLLPIEALRYE